MHTHGAGARDALDAAKPARLGRRPENARPRVRRRLGIGPVVELLAPAAPVRQAAHVRTLLVRTLRLLVGDVAVLVPVLLLGDAEVHEGAVPDVGEGHGCADVTPARGLRPPGRASRPPARRRRSPGSSPSTAPARRAARPARATGGNTDATTLGRPSPAASSSARARLRSSPGTPQDPPARRRISSARRRGSPR